MIAAAATAALLLLGSALLEFLLALGELFQFAQGFVDFLRALLLFPALYRFVLVLVLIELQPNVTLDDVRAKTGAPFEVALKS